MENQITTAQNNALSAEQLNNFLNIAGVGRNLPEQQRKQFIEIAQAYQLNPFKREIYCVSYAGNTSIITGYEVYIKRAERTGKLNGWNVQITGSGEDMVAKITIYRKDWEKPFEHEVYFAEAVNKKKDGEITSIWQKMPRFMLKKVAIGQGFRMCFSDELGGMPYTADEIGQQEQSVSAPVAQTEIKEAEIVEPLPKQIIATLKKATNAKELYAIYRDIVEGTGDIYRKQLNDYYRAHKGDFGA